MAAVGCVLALAAVVLRRFFSATGRQPQELNSAAAAAPFGWRRRSPCAGCARGGPPTHGSRGLLLVGGGVRGGRGWGLVGADFLLLLATTWVFATLRIRSVRGSPFWRHLG